MMVVKRALTVLILCLSLTSFAEASGGLTRFYPTRSGQRALDALRQTVSRDRESAIRAVLNGETTVDGGEAFGLEQRSFILDWFSSQKPYWIQRPGDDVAPSLERDGVFPAELRQRFQPLPLALESQLPTLSRNLRRGLLLGDVVLLDEDTSRIVDLIHGVQQAQ